MTDEKLKNSVMKDIVLLWLIGVKVVLVHGGGPEITDTLAKLGKETVFKNGLRVTDKETVDVVQMVLAGKINKSLVNLLGTKGGKAIGLSGIDGRMITAKAKNTELGYVGDKAQHIRRANQLREHVGILLHDDSRVGQCRARHVAPEADVGVHEEGAPVEVREPDARLLRDGIRCRCVDEEVLDHERHADHVRQADGPPRDCKVGRAVEEPSLDFLLVIDGFRGEHGARKALGYA